MNWLVEPFSFDFMQRALLAGILVAAVTSIVGTWVVLRGLSFIGDALAHGVLPGIALGVLFGFSQLIGAVVSALVMVWGIGTIHRKAKLSEDTGIGLLFVGMLGLGVVIISRTSSYAGSLAGILFGDALGVDTRDLRILAVGLVAIAFNSIRLQILTLRDEIEVSKLIGATDAFIQRPFLYLGLLQGLAGVLVALALVWGALALLNTEITGLAQTYGSDFRLPFLSLGQALVLAVVSGGLGWLGAYMSVSKYLREIEPA